jgi:hypothetical protein
MRTLIFFFLLFIGNHLFSQITCDFTLPSQGFLTPVYLTPTTSKYMMQDTSWNNPTHFTLYNLDGSYFKTINFPQKPNNSATVSYPFFISTSLFDNDSTTIEFMLMYYWDTLGVYNGRSCVKVLREDGTVLLNEQNASMPNVLLPDFNGIPIIFQTSNGVKLQLLYYTTTTGLTYQVKVFNLPGNILTSINTSENEEVKNIKMFPNPNSGIFHLQKNGNLENSQVEIYSTNGEKIWTSNYSDDQINLSTRNLPNGLYLLKIIDLKSGTQNVLKMIIQK